jgi:hypothetical protein
LRLLEVPFAWLLRKEWRELISARSWWVFMLLIGPLVGVSFISAVQTYAEASGLGGTSAGVGEAYSPLIGIWAPTFSACELAAAFLFPFVAIRQVAGDRQSGALKLELQQPMSPVPRVTAKAIVLLVGWIISMAAPMVGVLLWKAYGGGIYAPELLTVILGHLLNAGLTIALAGAAAALTQHPSTAAILTLSVTVGCWIINFIAAVHGGLWERATSYTPTAMIAEFQHGLIRLSVLLVAVALTAAGLLLTAIWSRLGVKVSRRTLESVALGASSVAVIVACTFVTSNWDLSENRMNSFSRAEEQSLRLLRAPLSIEVHLAPEDPRRADLEHRALSKLRRIVPDLHIRYVSATTIGLFEQSNPDYGEIIYMLNGRTATNRATTPEAVLETIFSLANITSLPDDTSAFRGHPLAAAPKGAAFVFYVLWPAILAVCGVITFRRNR